MKALDTNGDGTLSADEIANASASLKTLDKNGDGKLTPDKYRPEPPLGGPKGDQGQGQGQGQKPPGQNGQNGGNNNAAGTGNRRPAAE